MSDDVMRFDLEGDVLGPTIQPVENGQYVRYEDYQQLVLRLDSALERMDRARSILTKDAPTWHCNWGMLDTSDLRGNGRTCAHEFVDPTNEAIRADGWLVCVHCGKLKPPDDAQAEPHARDVERQEPPRCKACSGTSFRTDHRGWTVCANCGQERPVVSESQHPKDTLCPGTIGGAHEWERWENKATGETGMICKVCGDGYPTLGI